MKLDFIKDGLKNLYHMARPRAVEWGGDYNTWSEAAAHCTGYDQNEIADKAFSAALMVMEGKAAYCRDGFCFHEHEYTWPLIWATQRLKLSLGRDIRVLDFGGAFGDLFLQNQGLLEKVVETWVVVEQESMLLKTAKLPRLASLGFSPFDQIRTGEFDLIVISSVLQYIEDYEFILKRLKSMGAIGIYLDRTGFVESGRTSSRITKQVVRPPIYDASYPCRFFDRVSFIELFRPYLQVARWNALDVANIPSQYLGMYMEKELL